MNSSINLVSSKNDELEKEHQRLKIVRIIAAACLIIVALFSVLIFVINFTLPLSAVKKNQQLELANISSMHKKLVTYQLLNDRINSISRLMSQRKNYADRINTIYSKLPKELAVDALEVDKGQISLTVSGTSLLKINDFINSLIELKDKNKIIQNVNIQGLSFDAIGGKYSLSAKAIIL